MLLLLLHFCPVDLWGSVFSRFSVSVRFYWLRFRENDGGEWSLVWILEIKLLKKPTAASWCVHVCDRMLVLIRFLDQTGHVFAHVNIKSWNHKPESVTEHLNTWSRAQTARASCPDWVSEPALHWSPDKGKLWFQVELPQSEHREDVRSNADGFDELVSPQNNNLSAGAVGRVLILPTDFHFINETAGESEPLKDVGMFRWNVFWRKLPKSCKSSGMLL